MNVDRALLVQKLTLEAVIPFRASQEAAGYDLTYSKNEAIIIKPGHRVVVNTDLSIQLPKGTYGRIAPRSGLAVKYGINVLAGVIDSDYRGNVGVVLHNTDLTGDFEVVKGMKIAQLIVECISTPDVFEIHKVNDTSRGAHGYGSTG